MPLQKKAYAALLLAVLIVVSCKKEDPAPAPVDADALLAEYFDLDWNNLPNYAAPFYPVHYDANILAADNAPSINPVSDAGAALGRVLFYDKQLSRNNTVACASCHKQELGFTDDKVLSSGFDGGLTGAHSMRLANANFYSGERMFWNKRAVDLEAQSTMPIHDPVEMGFDASAGGMDSLIRKLSALPYYPVLFEKVFGTPDITEERMQRALAQFVRSMVSADSKFDRGLAQVYQPGQPGASLNLDFPNFTPQENLGKRLFLLPPPQGGAGCAGCHQPPTFALAQNSLSNGLDPGETTVFKSPSLKNSAVAGPYMHDGRFQTLTAVVQHYNNGIQNGPALDNRLRGPNGQPLRLNLDANQVQALVAFLGTLNDDVLLNARKFGDPFR